MGDAAGITGDATGQLAVDYEKLLNYADRTGMLESDWMRMKQWLYQLNEIGEVTITGAPDVEGGWQNYADATEHMRDATEHASNDMKTVRAELEEAARIAAESTPEALQMPVDVTGYEHVTDQVAAMNMYLDELKLSGNSAGAEQMLSRLQAAAEAAGGSLEIVDGKIMSIKDASGNDADWQGLRTLINSTGMATAASMPNGINIFGLDDTTYKISFEVDESGIAQTTLQTIIGDAETAAQTRTIQFNTDGEVENISLVTQTLSGLDVRYIAFYTNGLISGAEVTETNANLISRERRILYSTDGHIEHIEDIDLEAGKVTATREIRYAADGKVESLDLVDAEADSILHIRDIEYDANDDLMNARLTLIDQTADAPTQKTRYIRFDGETKDFTSKANAIPLTAEEKANAASNKAIIKITANDDDITQKLDDAEKSVVASTDAINGGAFGTFSLNADNKPALDAIKQVEDAWGAVVGKPDHVLELSGGKDLNSVLHDAMVSAISESDLLSEADRSYYTQRRNTVELYADENGNMVEKAVSLDEYGNGTEVYSTYDQNGNLLSRKEVEVTAVVSDVDLDGQEVDGGTWVPETADFEVEPDEPIEVPVEPKVPETHYPWDSAVKSIQDFFSFQWANPSGNYPTPPGEYFPWSMPV